MFRELVRSNERLLALQDRVSRVAQPGAKYAGAMTHIIKRQTAGDLKKLVDMGANVNYVYEVQWGLLARFEYATCEFER